MALVGVLFTMLACGGHKYETVKNDPQDTKIYTLDNGLKVYMSVNKETPRIQTYIAVKVGSKNDPAETTGLAHYFEHLMFKGTEQFGTTDYAAEKPMLDQIEALFEQYRSTENEAQRQAIYHRIDSISYEASKIAIPNEYDKLMSLIGAKGTNAWTSNDETVYQEDIPSNQIDNWARIQADRFRNNVIRGFHTELETIYEEKNMSLTQDNRKMFETLLATLYPNHPYGKQTTLGSQDHLKNPSITNVKKYHDEYYVPNNIAICVSGDFDPDEMVAAIEKYFGDWQPNPSVPKLEIVPEKPITSPIVKDIYGLESEYMYMAWRLPGSSDIKTSAVSNIAQSILYNGSCGLMDLDITQQQKAMMLGASSLEMADYGGFIVIGYPKEGQKLEDLRTLALEEIAKLKSGDFDESLIAATINNLKLDEMRSLESNSSRARRYVDAFISGIDWKDAAGELERLEAVTKEDIVKFANEYLGDDNYAVLYKRIGEDKTVKKISAPKITPIVSNRDAVSDFVKEIQNSEVKPIEPVFVDFSNDMAKFELKKGAEILYKKNTLNDIFTIEFNYNYGIADNPALYYAADYVDYLGTASMSKEEFASKMYELGCDYTFNVGMYSSRIRLSGLSENMEEAIKLYENMLLGAVGDDTILDNLKKDIIKTRSDNKKSQSNCFSALQLYLIYGPECVKKRALSDETILSFRSDDILSAVKDVLDKGHEILYYGPMKTGDLEGVLKGSHHVAEGAEILPERYDKVLQTPESKVFLAQYDAKQLYYMQYSNRGETFDPFEAAGINMYNEYFGGGMNAIVFQEMREARGLAYSASATLATPNYNIDDSYKYLAVIATQNDKMRSAIEAFDSIINDMPESEAAFQIAKEAIIGRMRTSRTTGMSVLRLYQSCRRLGLGEPMNKQVFHDLQTLELNDVVKVQQKWVKDRTYQYAILGDIKDLDTKYLSTLGQVKVLTLEDIFGY